MKDKPSPSDTGDMSVDEFRARGYEAIDLVADYLEGIEDYAVRPAVEVGFLKEQLPPAAPSEGEPMERILDDVRRLVAPGLTHWNHPGFLAYFSSSGSAPGIIGELLCSAFNVNAMLWHSAPAATELEEVVLAWLRQASGLLGHELGIIYDTASTSSLHALAAAREAAGDDVRRQGLDGSARLRVYASRQAHSSITKAAITLGLGLEGVRLIECDGDYAMSAEGLKEAIREDLEAGCRPCCVVATVGTTGTASVDPVEEILEVARAHGLWVHVDAAYAGSAALLPECRQHFKGWEKADSVVVNPHKWLFTPLDLSVLYCRRPDDLRRAFSLVPEYLQTQAGDEAVNYMDFGVPLGRRFRALKLWMVMRYFGIEGLQRRLREHCRIARSFAERIDAEPDFERLAPVHFSTVCFRARPAGMPETSLDALNRRLLAAVNRRGRVFLSHTELSCGYVLRLAVGNIRTAERHVDLAWEEVQQALG